MAGTTQFNACFKLENRNLKWLLLIAIKGKIVESNRVHIGRLLLWFTGYLV